MSNNYDQNNENKYSNSYGENQNSQNKQSSKNQSKKSGAFAGTPLFTYFWNAYIMILCLMRYGGMNETF